MFLRNVVLVLNFNIGDLEYLKVKRHDILFYFFIPNLLIFLQLSM